MKVPYALRINIVHTNGMFNWSMDTEPILLPALDKYLRDALDLALQAWRSNDVEGDDGPALSIYLEVTPCQR